MELFRLACSQCTLEWRIWNPWWSPGSRWKQGSISSPLKILQVSKWPKMPRKHIWLNLRTVVIRENSNSADFRETGYSSLLLEKAGLSDDCSERSAARILEEIWRVKAWLEIVQVAMKILSRIWLETIYVIFGQWRCPHSILVLRFFSQVGYGSH